MNTVITSNRVGRVLTLLCAVAVVIGLCAGCDPAKENDFLAQVNQVRASHGLPALTMNPTLQGVARTWTDHMISTGGLSHNPSLVSQAPAGWRVIGENVGYGPDVNSVMQAFIHSPPHFANLVNPAYRSVGIGVTVTPSGQVWVTQDFMG